jgi:dihydroorotate dehydrogenase (NAD+) catalytic subunit
VGTWEDAVQFFLAGADAVQVGSATVRKFEIFNEINLGIISYMERKGIAKLGDIVGAAHRGGLGGRLGR